MLTNEILNSEELQEIILFEYTVVLKIWILYQYYVTYRDGKM